MTGVAKDDVTSSLGAEQAPVAEPPLPRGRQCSRGGLRTRMDARQSPNIVEACLRREFVFCALTYWSGASSPRPPDTGTRPAPDFTAPNLARKSLLQTPLRSRGRQGAGHQEPAGAAAAQVRQGVQRQPGPLRAARHHVQGAARPTLGRADDDGDWVGAECRHTALA